MKLKSYLNPTLMRQKLYRTNQMNIVKKLPGPLLVFMGAVCLSFGGLIVKSFEGANLWQILFWRQTFLLSL